MINATPAELSALKQAIYRQGIPAREYLDRMNDVDARAEAEIIEYVKVMRSIPAVALMRIAAKMSWGAEKAVMETLKDLLDTSDPEDVPNALDHAHRSLDDLASANWDIE